MNEREAIVECGRLLHERGLSPGTSGNISMRVENDFLLTPTNASLGALDAARLSRLSLDGRHVGGDAPTKEAFLHLAMYAERPEAQAIVHLHCTHAVAVSCLEELDPNDALPPLTPYYVMRVGRLPLVPYARPGDVTLAENVRRRARRSGALLLANHGPIVAAVSLEAAVSAIGEIEETAKLVLLTWGLPVRRLNRNQAAELRQPPS
jgi:ribulose-5-phosphate 4-epimerase/fuculose-1-phosphate aldolase